MRRLLALTWKEFMQLKRDRLTLRMIIVIPIMQTLVFGYAINYDVKHLKTVVLDESRSYDSRELVARLTASEYFDIVGRVDSLTELQSALDSATASVGLVIDREYGTNRHRGKPAEAFLVVNASDTTTASQAMSIASGVATQAARRARQAQRLTRVIGLDAREVAGRTRIERGEFLRQQLDASDVARVPVRRLAGNLGRGIEREQVEAADALTQRGGRRLAGGRRH